MLHSLVDVTMEPLSSRYSKDEECSAKIESLCTLTHSLLIRTVARSFRDFESSYIFYKPQPLFPTIQVHRKMQGGYSQLKIGQGLKSLLERTPVFHFAVVLYSDVLGD
jgi:hypothetical protein